MCQQLHKSLPMFIPMYWKITIKENYKISCGQDCWKILKVFQPKIKWQKDRYKSYKIYCQSIEYYKLFEEHFFIKLSLFFNMYILTWKRDIYFLLFVAERIKICRLKALSPSGEFFFCKEIFLCVPLGTLMYTNSFSAFLPLEQNG